MNTTLLFAEILVIGLQAGIWSVLLAGLLFGFEWLALLSIPAVQPFTAILIAVGLSIFYVLGIVVDRVADFALTRLEKNIRNQFYPHLHNRSVSALRYEISKDKEYLNRQFEYIRSRLRIARASSLNFLIITILAVILLRNQVEYLLPVGIVGVLLTAGTFLAWVSITKSYYLTIKSNEDFENQKKRGMKR